MAFLFLLGLIMFGPKRLPELSRQLGRIVGELRRASQEFQSQLSDEVRKIDQDNDLSNTINNFQVTGTTARERLLNAVMDAGQSIKSSFEEKSPEPKALESQSEPVPVPEVTATPEIIGAHPPAVSTEEPTKETIH